ncbi:MAG: TIGR02147 family protein [Deltaproteobacteria bacterium]|nr:TIGR02147 family protein [Deltaproteobacteria bacterium]
MLKLNQEKKESNDINPGVHVNPSIAWQAAANRTNKACPSEQRGGGLNIFSYEDHRIFLGDYYNLNKRLYPEKFSFRYFARVAGFDTSNFLHLVINGRRNLGHNSIKKLSLALKLKKKESDYFENMVCFSQAKDAGEKSKYYEKMVSFKGFQDVHMVDDSQKLYLSKWYFPVIREMVNLEGFRLDPKYIVAMTKPKISLEQATEALDVLMTLGMIKQDKDSKWVLGSPQLKSKDNTPGFEIMNYHKKMIQLGFECLSMPAKDRNVSGITMSISPAKFELIKEKIEEFKEDVQNIVRQPDTHLKIKRVNIHPHNKEHFDITQVSQLNIQFFNLAKKGS